MNRIKIDRLAKPVFILSIIVLVVMTGCSSAPTAPSQVTILQPKSASEANNAAVVASENPELVGTDSTYEQPAELAALAVEAAAPALELAAKQAGTTQDNAPAVNSADVESASTGQVQSPAANNEQAPATAAGDQPTVGFLAPDFTLNTINGQPLNLSSLRGKSVVINYWVTWCVPCLKEMPALEKLYKEYEQNDLVVLSINGIAQDDLDKVSQTVAELGLTYPVVLDENEQVFKAYWLGFMPTSIFIDNQGVIRHIKFGDASEEEFRTKIEQLLAGTL